MVVAEVAGTSLTCYQYPWPSNFGKNELRQSKAGTRAPRHAIVQRQMPELHVNTCMLHAHLRTRTRTKNKDELRSAQWIPYSPKLHLVELPAAGWVLTTGRLELEGGSLRRHAESLSHDRRCFDDFCRPFKA